MTVLIIDDSDYKIESLEELLRPLPYVGKIRVARSFHGGLHAILSDKPDIILMDMSIPTSERDDGSPDGRDRMFGGRELMAEMQFHHVTAHVIVVTQFDQFGAPDQAITLEALLDELHNRFPSLFLGGVYYNIVDSGWKLKLVRLLSVSQRK